MERVKRKILAEHRSLSKTRKKITDFAVRLDFVFLRKGVVIEFQIGFLGEKDPHPLG